MYSMFIIVGLVVLAISMGEVQGSRVFFTNAGVNCLVESSSRYCKIHTDRNMIRFLLKYNTNINYLSEEELAVYRKQCEESQLLQPGNGTFTYPGTLWCGPGFIARNYTDLGFHYREDACCREHDHCADFIPAGMCRGELCNNTPYTRSHCECDRKFKRCLQDLNSEPANTIGAIFFNIAKLVCFESNNATCRPTKNSSDSAESDTSSSSSDKSDNNNSAACGNITFFNAGRYSAGRRSRFNIFNKKEYLLNIFLRKLGLL